MAKYIFVYRSGQPFDISKLPKEQVTQMMQAWGEWVGSMGPAVIDSGSAFNAGSKSVKQNGIERGDEFAAGYSIIEASTFDEALSLAQGSPIVARGGSVEVYEAFGA